MLTYLSSTQVIRMTTKPLTYRKGRSKEVHCTGTIRGRWEQEGNRNPRLNSCLPTDAYSYPVHGKMIEVMKYLTPHALLSGKSHKKKTSNRQHTYFILRYMSMNLSQSIQIIDHTVPSQTHCQPWRQALLMEAFMLHPLPIFLLLHHATKGRSNLNL